MLKYLKKEEENLLCKQNDKQALAHFKMTNILIIKLD